MGHLDPPVLPPFLYRYRRLTHATIDREIAAIREQVIWCSVYKDLNDPMEGFYDPSQRVLNLDRYAEVARQLLSHKQTIGICCFSDTPDNELMWTHYAGNYSGICVSFRSKKLLAGLPDHAHLVRLGYGVAPPEVGVADTGDLNAAARKILSHKKFSWAYEREWRVLANQGALTINSPECVGDVRLGSRIDPHHRDRLEVELGDLPLRISAMAVDKYGHEWKPLKTKKKRYPPLAAE